ncbi:hypothetical protein AV530_015293 [Patagioenas fasciata monilis]|uniref:Uncharacterized protein n=1 Tax=Patagioenas fasciata monilis TaxID=372326 RepID=A0A1V4K1K1_PATFA|nr:hypothetical protein AV530_015293 [Patagioenas fasciata monilis]
MDELCSVNAKTDRREREILSTPPRLGFGAQDTLSYCFPHLTCVLHHLWSLTTISSWPGSGTEKRSPE